MKLLPIQEQKISEVVNKLNLPTFTNKNPLYFQSPTGSGKTKMLARIIEEYKYSNPSDKLLFLVASISTGGIE
jgi:superfamily II DNA or RNA helicase